MNEASQPLRDKGIKIYVVGVGSKEDIDEDELIQIAGTQENVLTTDLFEELVVLAEDVTKVICGKKKKHLTHIYYVYKQLKLTREMMGTRCVYKI